MTRLRMCSVLMLSILVVGPALAADDTDRAEARRRKQANRRAQQITRDLITDILDIQLQQLKENGLEKKAVYFEINDMRKNIDKLVKTEMRSVVDLLTDAQVAATKKGRKEKMRLARVGIRDVVFKLQAERQKLLRRLKRKVNSSR